MPLALVTGANRGLGLETCRQLIERGFEVLVAARNPSAGQAATSELGPAARFVPLEVESERSVASLCDAIARGPKLDALVNNAGIALKGFDADIARRTLDVNVNGPMRVTDGLLPYLAPNANVVMVSSGMGELRQVSPPLRQRLLDQSLTRAELEDMLAGFLEAVRDEQPGTSDLRGWPRSAYSVSKIALNALTRILDREFAARANSPVGRLRVNAVCPGWVRTRMGGSEAPRDVKHGASGIVWAATLGEGGPSGGFFRDKKLIDW